MKKTFFVLLLATVLIAVSCSKSNSEPEPAPWTPQGYWVGYYTDGASIQQENYSMLLLPGGFARIYDMGNKSDTTELSPLSKASGSWVYANQILNVTYKVSSHIATASATLQAGQTEMTGIWSLGEVPKGNFYLSK